jgi:alpha-mannosidase
VPTPAAQCLGPFAAEFAIAWHAGDSSATRAHISALAEDALLPLTGDTRRDLVTLPPPLEGIALAGEGLVFSALKESDDGNYVVARCLNISDVEVHGAWVLPRAPGSAHVSRLDETPIAPLPMRGNRVAIVVAPHAIHTVLFSLDDGGELR